MIFAKIMPIAWADHLWQSTLVAVGVALLARILRKNCAQTRYALWLIASLKFLIPFSALVAMGSRLRWPSAVPVPHAALSAAVQQISYPFIVSVAAPLASRPATSSPAHMLPGVLFAIWLAGFLAVLFSWSRRWLRLRAAVRAATRLPLEIPIQVLSSASRVEPGIFGIVRPVLLLPESIIYRLAPEHLRAIFAHELCHVRRRDNLAAALHMLVELIFWFYPLVWWIGVRLIEERERACDEEVLRLGNRPQVYAESILKTCQFCLESPLACMSGVTGSDLKERIVRIMSGRIAHRLAFWKKLLLAASATLAVTLPVASGILNALPSRAQSQPAANTEMSPSFEVASIKPTKSGTPGMVFFRIDPGGRFMANGIPLLHLIEQAYDVKDSQISGTPAWASSERFDIEAKPDEETAAQMQKMKPEERHETLRLMLQSLLADRFQLKVSRSTKELPVYALVVGRNGPKIKKSDLVMPNSPPAALPPLPPPGNGPPTPMMKGEGIMMRPGHLSVNGAPLDRFADILSRILGRPVIDDTGLQGNYEFTLNWTPDQNEGPMMPGGPPPGLNASSGGPAGAGSGPGVPGGGPETAPPDTSGPNIFTAVQEQLGLKLESQKGPVELLVIQHVERPSEN